jgi:hypothetical protein
MMKKNPLRINYYERYQEIVDEYNRDDKKDEIAIIFENLMKLVSELDEEQKRYVKEGFDSDEELTMFDLLCKDKTLTKEEIKKVKKLSQDMLKKIKERIRELDHWTDKEETQSIISVMILFYAVGHWNNYVDALIFITDEKYYPLQLVLKNLLISAESQSNSGSSSETILEQLKIANQIKYSSIVVSSLPIIIIYPFIEKYFDQGILVGSFK